jgi:ribosomal protein S18 acetylase RimI-like enzyme
VVGSPIFEPFDKKRHSREDFSCEVESHQTYFRNRANQDMQRKLAAVFVLAQGSTVLGYYTLSSYGIDAGELPKQVISKLPTYPRLPAVLIGRLARDDKYRGQEIGQMLLVDVLRRSLSSTATVGAIAVVVEAENEKARKFYSDYGFIKIPDNNDKLFMSMETIKKL